ncbi:MAG: 2-oxo acid dehydrogenase subunit E2 [Gemmatimonadales bacterium]|nr:2-oxo acid dehydrogenase subunit E2 [Gemmatimonadales bacterium]
MSTNVVMEALSPTMEEGRLVEWKKQEGDVVAVGDVLAEVETDKAVMELVARAGGTLLKQAVAAGATVPVSQVVAVIGEPGEKAEAPEAKAPETRAPEATPAPVKPPPESTAPRLSPAASPDNGVKADAAAASIGTGARIKASPLARRMAAERGIDLGGVEGTGPEGRVVVRDLDSVAAPTTGPAPIGAQADGAAYQDVPLTQIRKTIARRLAQSIGPVPTFYLTSEVDMERAWDARAALNTADESSKVSFNDIIIKAAALALRRHPACNAWWQDDRIRFWNEVHIGMAVAIDEGLITPVIRDADRKGLRAIGSESRDLAGRARQRRLKPEEFTGSTFSISNLGMLDIDEFTAIINPPEAGILAIGRIAERAVAEGGRIEVRRRMRLTMSCDHRVIDGATGAQFLRTLKGMLENPLAMVW